jgi:quercetin dioxygenase-like cupin family protein
MTTPYTFFAGLATEAPIPARGILSQKLSNGGDIEFLLFAFAAGEQLSEHMSARPVIIHLLEGEGELTVGGDTHPARPGTWSRMAPEVKHGLVARTPMQMALYLLPR